MKLNATPRHYMPLPQNQSDDDESVPSKEDKVDKVIFKNSFDASEGTSKSNRITGKDEVNPKNLPMSPMRLVMFIISLITCVLFVLIFVFCVPCTMPENMNELCYLTYKWRKVLHNMTFTAPVDVIDNERLKNRLIVLGYTSIESGLIAIQETDGKEFWKLHLHSLPLSISCNSLDVNSDGVPECLVIGDNGLLTAIDAKEGVSLWYLHNHSNLNNANSINGPAVVPDCDDDDIMDIVISYKVIGNEDRSHLALVSGGTGQIIGSLIELSQCIQPSLMKFSWKSQNDKHLVLHCTTEKNDELWLLSSKDICSAAINETRILVSQNNFRIPHFTQDIQFYEIAGSDNQFVIALDGIQFMLLKSSHLNLQTVWHTYVDANHHMRIVTDGQFVNGSGQLVITNSGGQHSKILGLSLADGREVWSILHDNGTVASATKFQNFFGDTDGLLIKLLSSEHPHRIHSVEENISRNSSEQNGNNDLQLQRVKNLRLLRESYVFVKCGKVPVIKTIHEENIWIDCKVDGTCNSNMYTTNSTVIVKAEELGKSFDMFTVTSTELLSSNSKEMIIKCFNLKNVSTHPRCEG